MGDNLAEARDFVTFSASLLDRLLGAVGPIDRTQLQGLSELTRRAKAVNAIAIARAGQLTVRDIENSYGPRPDIKSNVQGHLLGLNKLVTQYRSGLEELEAAVKNTAPTAKDRADPAAQLRKLHAFTAENLHKLIRFAPVNNRAALRRLMQPSQEGAQMRRLGLEDIYADLTNDFLALARQQGKTISVSFSADPLAIEPEILSQFKDYLRAMGQLLIEDAIEVPEKRKAQGLTRAAHIALTCKAEKDRFHLLLTCDGRAVKRRALTEIEPSALKDMGMKSGLSIDGPKIKIAVADVPLCARAGDAEKIARTA